MLYMIQYTFQTDIKVHQIYQRLQDLNEAGQINRDLIRHWSVLVGGGAGLMLVEADDPRKVNEMLLPWMDLISFDVRAMIETNLDEQLGFAKEILQSRGS